MCVCFCSTVICRVLKPTPSNEYFQAMQAVQLYCLLTIDARKQPIAQWIQCMIHAIQCQDASCPDKECLRLKSVLNHARNCKSRAFVCMICKWHNNLCYYHEKDCTIGLKCLVPYCWEMKQKQVFRQTITDNQRKHLADLIYDSISSPFITEIFSKPVHNKHFYANNVETGIFNKACSKSAYYRLLAVEKWQMEMDIQETKNQRLFNSMHNVSTVSVQTEHEGFLGAPGAY